MIANCKPISHGKAAAEYDLEKQIEGEHVAKEIARHGVFGLDGSEIVREMQQHQAQFQSRLKNHYFRIEIVPSLDEDAAHWTDAQCAEIVNDYMQRMGLNNTQWFAVKHDRTDHDLERHGKKLSHFHILANRIDMDGKVISDSYSQKKSIAVIEKMTRERGQKTADEVSKDLRATIKAKALEALRTLPSYDFEGFKAALADVGITARANISEKSGKMSGYYLSMGGKEWKASAIDRALTTSRVEKTWENERAVWERNHPDEIDEQKEERHEQHYKPRWR